MSSSGLTCSPLRYTLHLPARVVGSSNDRVTFITNIRISKDFLCLRRNTLVCSAQQLARRTSFVRCAMDASYGNATDDSAGPAIFPRIHVKDPYKRLGISREASEDEIQAARNFLILTFGRHKPSVDAIESAHDKIIMQKFYERKNPKINIKKKVRELSQSRVVQAIMMRRRPYPSSCHFFTSYRLFHLQSTEEQTPRFSLWGWNFCYLMASGNIFDGFGDATHTQRAKKFGSDNFIDKLHFPLGCFHLPYIETEIL